MSKQQQQKGSLKTWQKFAIVFAVALAAAALVGAFVWDTQRVAQQNATATAIAEVTATAQMQVTATAQVESTNVAATQAAKPTLDPTMIAGLPSLEEATVATPQYEKECDYNALPQIAQDLKIIQSAELTDVGFKVRWNSCYTFVRGKEASSIFRYFGNDVLIGMIYIPVDVSPLEQKAMWLKETQGTMWSILLTPQIADVEQYLLVIDGLSALYLPVEYQRALGFEYPDNYFEWRPEMNIGISCSDWIAIHYLSITGSLRSNTGIADTIKQYAPSCAIP